MAIHDDLRSLAAEDVLYLVWSLAANPAVPPNWSVIYRGRLIQAAASGNWVFDTSAGGSNGVQGIVIGPEQDSWRTNETPGGGKQISLTWPLWGDGGVTITLSTVIPADLGI